MKHIEVYILDKDFNAVGLIDEYVSLLWVDRYSGASVFELYSSTLPKGISMDSYLHIRQSDKIMIVENIHISSDNTEGFRVQISGRSLESLLTRRIIWNTMIFNDTPQSAIKKIVDTNITMKAPEPARRIPNLDFVDKSYSEFPTEKEKFQISYDNVYDTVVAMLDEHNLAFKIELNRVSNTETKMEMSLYKGTDRSLDQDVVPQILFSPDMGNLMTSSYLENTLEYKNVAKIAGEDKGETRTVTVIGDSNKGILRRELYVDARDLQTENEDGTTIPAADYKEMLQARGKSKMQEHIFGKDFQAIVEDTPQVELGVDVFLGDVVHVRNEYGMMAKVRMIEIVIASDTSNGRTILPTFREDPKEV